MIKYSEAVVQKCCKKSVLRKNFAKFTGNTCVRVSFLIKLLAQAKFLGARFPTEHLQWLLLNTERLLFTEFFSIAYLKNSQNS